MLSGAGHKTEPGFLPPETAETRVPGGWALALSRALSLHAQMIAAMVGLVAITALAVGLMVYFALVPAIEDSSLTRARARVVQLALQLQNYTEGAQYEVASIGAATSVQCFFAALTTPEGHADGIDAATWRALVEGLIAAEVAAKPGVVQMRLIDLDGRELLRVEANQAAPPRIVAAGDLQDKAERAYVAETLSLPPGAVYVSPLDLNREFGVLEEPHRTVIRIGAPVDGPDGVRRGLVIINLDMGPALEHLRAATPQDGALYLVNTDGDFLLHPDPTRAFGFDLGQRHRINEDEPALLGGLGRDLDAIAPEGMSALVGTTVVAAASARLAGRTPVVLIETEPDGTATATRAVRRSAFVAGSLAAVVAALLALFLARATTRPIVAMTRSVEADEGGDALPLASGGEVGVLARALARHLDREHWHGAVLDNSSEAIMTTTPHGIITGVNSSAERLFQLSASEALGRSLQSLLPSQHADAVDATLRRIAQGETVEGESEMTLGTPQSGLTDVKLRASPVRSTGGTLLGASIVARDVTEERAAVEAFRLATEWSPAGMVLIDREHRIRLVNAELERRFDYSREELLGEPLERLVPDSATRHPHLVDQFFQAPESRAMDPNREVMGRRKDGSLFPVEVRLTPVPSRDGTLVLAAIVDVSELRRALDALKDRSLELERSNNDLTHFANVASHDLQEPLRAVLSFAQLLADRYKGQLDERGDRYIEFIVGSAKRMRALIHELLVFSSLEAGERAFESIEMDKALEGAREALSGAIAESGATIEVPEPLPLVRGELANLTRLFQNLIANAIKYRRDVPPHIHIAAERQGNLWCLSVTDNGVGFENKYKESIFAMFQRLQVSGAQRGSGLGLAIAKRIVEQHGGSIWAEGRPGKGATFHFTLPAVS
ncbi:MAG: hypothetical protein AcusKO_22270 [Acuticoccus sp.]